MERTIIIECKKCKGTGLCQGINEEYGAATICSKCGGTCKIDFSYNEFEGRKEIKNITRVFKAIPGYIHSGKDVTDLEGNILHFSKYGCSYEEWESGINPKPMEELYCPNEYDNKWKYHKRSLCKQCGERLNSCNDCKFYSNKDKCWKEWHKNNY